MTVFDRMAVQLKATNLYKMNGSSLIEAEMLAYGKALDIVADMLDSMLKNCFFDDPSSSNSSLFERLFCFPRTIDPTTEPGLSIRAKKINMMKSRLAIRNNNFNRSGITAALLSAGIDATFTENFSAATVTVNILSDDALFATDSERDDFIRNMMPCSAEIIIRTM